MSWYRTAARFEARNWSSLWRWVRKNPRIPADGEAFAHDAPLRAVIALFTAASAVEVVAVDLILNHFLGHLPALRFAALALGVWGVTMMLGYAAQLRTSPHVVTADGLHVRHLRGTIVLPWDCVCAVDGARRNFPTSKAVQRSGTDEAAELHLPVQNATTVAVRLSRLVAVDLPDGPVEVHRLTFHADDVDALVAAAARHLDPQNRQRV